jgi:hypothetical protein
MIMASYSISVGAWSCFCFCEACAVVAEAATWRLEERRCGLDDDGRWGFAGEKLEEYA